MTQVLQTPDLTITLVGGAGYIGSHTTIALNEAGYETIVYDNFSTGHRDACFGTYLVEGELTDTQKLIETMTKFNVVCVVHFAALIEAGQSVITPIPFFQNNVAGTLSLLEAMNAASIKRLVFSSTAAVYGNNETVESLSEELPLSPVNPYGESKAMIEKVLQTCVEAHGLHAIALRYFNACGADRKGRTGERHNPETHLIPLVIEAARGKRSQIYIYGTDYLTPDGTCIRDYIHVADLASGHVAAVALLLENKTPCFQPINLGTGSGLSVLDVINAVKRVSGIDIPIVRAERRQGDPATLIANATSAKHKLRWQATNSSIEQIVTDAWNYAEAKLE